MHCVHNNTVLQKIRQQNWNHIYPKVNHHRVANIFKWLDVNKLCLNVSKSRFMLFHMHQKVLPCLSFSLYVLEIEHVYNFNFLGLIINCHLDWKPHLNSIGIKEARVIGLLHKLRYTLTIEVL